VSLLEFPLNLDLSLKVLLFVRKVCRVPIWVRNIDTSKSSVRGDQLLAPVSDASISQLLTFVYYIFDSILLLPLDLRSFIFFSEFWQD
jgi:hypothetical protein